MQADELDLRARTARRMRTLVRELRRLGVPDSRIRQCHTVWELEDLHDRAIAHLMGPPESARAA